MTFRSDILVVVGTIAEEFAARMATTYCAGLRQEATPSCLIWASQPKSVPLVLATRQNTYRVSTCSWASLDFNIATTGLDYGGEYSPLIEVLDINITSPCGNKYTNVATAKLILNGRVEPVELSSLGEQLFSYNQHGLYYFTPGGYTLDTGSSSVQGINVHLLPVGIGSFCNRGEDICIQALLLNPLQAREGTMQTFERLGMATITISRCPPEL